LPTSDIDIGITGFERSSKSELIAVLGNLVDALERFSWVKAVERIFTASIPIVKIVREGEVLRIFRNLLKNMSLKS